MIKQTLFLSLVGFATIYAMDTNKRQPGETAYPESEEISVEFVVANPWAGEHRDAKIPVTNQTTVADIKQYITDGTNNAMPQLARSYAKDDLFACYGNCCTLGYTLLRSDALHDATPIKEIMYRLNTHNFELIPNYEEELLPLIND